MTDGHRHPVVLFASWIEPDLVDRVRGVDPAVEVLWEPELLPPPRYPADHTGAPLTRTDAAEARWRSLLARATILFDFDRTHLDDLPALAPRVEWIQATSAGIGQLVRRHRYAERMPRTVFTTARGVHAGPLAEFAVMAMLMHVRRVPDMVAAQRTRTWERFAGTDLDGRTLVILGLGAIGTRVARVARSLGLRVIGLKRTPEQDPADPLPVDELHGPDALDTVLPRAEFLVLVAPHTDRTEHLIGAAELSLLPPGAVLINIGRGALVDEGALIDALEAGHLGGAYLDVFEEEPLPTASPLWSMPKVLVSPHSASTSDRENERIAELFCDNLARYRSGRPLRNVLDPARMY